MRSGYTRAGKALIYRTGKNLIRWAGFELTRFPAPNTLECQLQRLLRDQPIRGAVDVGAHEGEFVHVLRDIVGYTGPIVSFEPSRASFNRLRAARLHDHAWTGHNVALGRATGTMKLNVFAGTDFNSLRPANIYGRARFPWQFREADEEAVEMRRLDELLDLPGPLLLKSDTQGYDLEVLEGAAGVIDRVEALVVELSVTPIYDGAPHIVEMLSHLRDLGFGVAGLFPIQRRHLRVVEFDGLFIRSR